MFSVALVGKAVASPWIDGHAIPQDLIEGVISTFIGLLILFSIKPRLRIEFLPVLGMAKVKISGVTGDKQPETPADDQQAETADDEQRSETFKFKVTNRRLRKVVEVKIRLWRVRKVGSRQAIDLVVDELFELRGNWSPLKPTWRSLLRRENVKNWRTGRNRDKDNRAHYTFYPKRGKLEEERKQLRQGDFILFQVIAKDSFTGFTRLKTERFYESDLNDVAQKAAASRQKSPTASDHRLTIEP